MSVAAPGTMLKEPVPGLYTLMTLVAVITQIKLLEPTAALTTLPLPVAPKIALQVPFAFRENMAPSERTPQAVPSDAAET